VASSSRAKWEVMGAPGSTEQDRADGIFSPKDAEVLKPYLPSRFKKNIPIDKNKLEKSMKDLGIKQ